jgi:hypothetical protein
MSFSLGLRLDHYLASRRTLRNQTAQAGDSLALLNSNDDNILRQGLAVLVRPGTVRATGTRGVRIC